MIANLPLFSKNVNKQIRSNKKFFIIDSGLRNSLLKIRDIMGENVGLLVESVIDSNLLTIREFKRHHNIKNITYFKDKQKHEVDIVLIIDDVIIPVEVKYQNNVYNHDLKNLKYFMGVYDICFGIVVTKNMFEQKGNILCIPAWMLLCIILS